MSERDERKTSAQTLDKTSRSCSGLAVSIQVDVPSKGVTSFSNATSDLHSDVRRPCKLRGRRPCLQTGRAQKHWYLRGFVAVDPQPRQGLRPRLKTGGAENTGIYNILEPSIQRRTTLERWKSAENRVNTGVFCREGAQNPVNTIVLCNFEASKSLKNPF